MPVTMNERIISLQGCGNFRDLGGYETADGRTIRWRRLFRSDALVWLTPEDVATLHGLGLNLIAGLDLRTPDEVNVNLPRVVYDNGTRHLHFPFFVMAGSDKARVKEAAYGLGPAAGESYLYLLEQAKPCFHGVMTFLADETSYPSAYYCAAGKDRTGMMTALLLRLLGIPDEQIIEDYALTQAPTEERLLARFEALGRDPAELPDRAGMAASPATMEHFLTGFDRLHGSVEEFLLSCDLQESTLERVRQNLLEG